MSEDEQRVAVAKKISGLMSQLGPGVRAVNTNWKQNPEVQEILNFPTTKRLAAVNLIIWGMRENDKILFKNAETNVRQKAAMLIARSIATSLLAGLVTDSSSDTAMRDFLASERADLELVLHEKIGMKFYEEERLRRDNKLAMIYMTDEKFVKQMLEMKMQNDQTVTRLTNKTSSVALLQTCTVNVELCAMM